MNTAPFLGELVASLLQAWPAWRMVYENKRDRQTVIAREIDGGPTVYLSFTGRPGNPIVDQSVGWAPDMAALLATLNRKETEPMRERDGSLARLRKLESPRDFKHDEMHLPISALCRPFGGFDLSKHDAQTVRASMESEITQFAFPYLSMMLAARHAITFPVNQFGS